MKRHAGVHRAFDLSTWAYFLDFAIAPIGAAALIGFAIAHRDGESVAMMALSLPAGLFLWSIVEYWVHRLLFHGGTPFEPMHEQHHALPKDMIGAASWVTFPGFSIAWFLASIAGGQALGGMITAGLILGYLLYCTIHVSMHHADAFGFGRYGQMMMRLHRAHHRGGKGNFGVSSPLWDIVFRTYQPARAH
jgi:sterol desaturase/sphingolipid hydroxylase (fatty acid hydroxylase superfamily)